ncbi:MAG: hypothetical protein CO119_01255 [Flavobacteriales bacterium CG_4_9_14_3_um_filter_40_17]|nr:MAG: hypothetical protein CO119_01255 [Flavobacteriales bacterium CG_4_9_14_3_um_filter_40_17]
MEKQNNSEHIADTEPIYCTMLHSPARKLAVIIWNMVVKVTSYINPEGYLFLDQKRKLGIAKRIQKQIDKFDLTNSDLNLTTD